MRQSFYLETEIKKTRKEHKCDGCINPIPSGSKAFRNVGVFEGDFFSVVLCKDCKEFMEQRPDLFEEGWSTGDVGMLKRQYGWKQPYLEGEDSHE